MLRTAPTSAWPAAELYQALPGALTSRQRCASLHGSARTSGRVLAGVFCALDHLESHSDVRISAPNADGTGPVFVTYATIAFVILSWEGAPRYPRNSY
jgi:hypothetical protein